MSTTGQRGQASVELVALLPLLCVLVGLAWQAALAGQAVWLSGAAARAAARARAVGGDEVVAARAPLPPAPGRLGRVRPARDGGVGLGPRVPAAGGRGGLGPPPPPGRVA